MPASKLPSDEIRAAILRAMRKGAPPDMAAAIAGVAPRTWSEWRQKGREGVEPYAALEAELGRADAEQELGYVMRIRKYGRQDWRSSAWLLERGKPQRWAVTRPEDGSGDGKAPRAANVYRNLGPWGEPPDDDDDPDGGDET